MKTLATKLDFRAIAYVAAMVVLLSTMFFIAAPQAKAQTDETNSRLEAMQKQITELLAIVSDLQERLSNFRKTDHVDTPKCKYVWSRTLYKGANGDDVKDLQRMLHKLGHYDEEETGYFGDATEEALKRFQNKRNIVSDGDPNTTGYGMFGPLTRAVMGDACKGVKSDYEHKDDHAKKDYHKDKGDDHFKKFNDWVKDIVIDDKVHDYDACVDADGEIYRKYGKPYKCIHKGHFYYTDVEEDDDASDHDVHDYDSCVEADGEVWSEYDKCEYDGDYYYEADTEEDKDESHTDSDVNDYDTCLEADGDTYTNDDGEVYKCVYDGEYHYAE